MLGGHLPGAKGGEWPSFFRVRGRMHAGYLLAVYWGDDTINSPLDYHAAITAWADSDRLLVDGHTKYAVRGSTQSLATYANEGFGRYNLYLVFNASLRRIEDKI